MNQIFSTAIAPWALVLACIVGGATLAPRLIAQNAATPAAPRTAWGTPDLRGLWNGTTITPLERPQSQTKEVLTEAEVKEAEMAAAKRNETDSAPASGDPGTYNQIWFDPGSRWVSSRRTSLVIDPKDGRIPFTPEGLARFRESNAHYGRGARGIWTDFDTGERCLTDGVPVYYSGYNNNYQFFQTEKYFVIVGEMFGDRRVIPLDGREAAKIPQWLGTSRGRWEGDTLVVETANFADKSHYWWAGAWRASRATLRLVERFTRVDAETIDYQFTMEDPVMFTRPWTAAYPLSSNQAKQGVTVGRLYEYACHEGNYALPNTMQGWLAQNPAAR
jgi:hypothetical protein